MGFAGAVCAVLASFASTPAQSQAKLASARALPLKARPVQRTTNQPRPLRPGSQRMDRISISFSNTDVRDVLATIADYSGIDVLVTPGAKGEITVSLRNRTPDQAVRLVSATAGLSVVRVGVSYLVGPPPELQKAVADLGTSELVPLRYLAADKAKEVLIRVAPRVSVEPAGSGIVITGMREDLAAARDQIRLIDVAPPPPAPAPSETEVFALKFVDPITAEKVIREGFPELKVSRTERALIIIGPRTELKGAESAILALDVEPPKQQEAPTAFVYRLKYLNAKKAEEALKKALPALTVTVAPEANAPPPGIFQPLSISALGGGGAGGSGGGFGQGSGAAGSSGQGAGAAAPGAEVQQLSRATRIIIVGIHADIEIARSLLDQTDLPQPIVRIEAALIEISDDALKSLGLDWNPLSTVLSPGPISGATFSIPGSIQPLTFSQPSRSSSEFSVALNALAGKNKVRILASPNISIVDNEDANIFIGDLIRFKGAVTSTNTSTVQQIETVPVGVALLVRPRVHPDGDVTLKVHPVVSQLTSLAEGIPQTSSREADTTVRLKAGEQLVIGGLKSDRNIDLLKKVPLLADLPIIGQLFQSRQTTKSKTEIIVIIRVYPVLTEPAPAHDFRRGSNP